MYPRNNASPERIGVGQVVLILDGTIQSAGVAITVRGQGQAEAAGAGTIVYNADNTVSYTPTQAETNYTSFVLIASKAACFSVSQTIITSAASTAGEVVSDAASRTASQADVSALATTAALATVDSNVDAILVDTGTTLDTKLNDIQGTTFSSATDSLEAIRDRGDAAWPTATGFALATVATEARMSELDAVTAGKMANQIDIIQIDTTTDIPASIAALNDVAATDIVSAGAITTLTGAVVNVDLVDTTTTNTDMRGTDSANTVAPDNTGIANIETQLGVAGVGLTNLGGMSTGMKAEVNIEADTALTDYDGPTNAEMEARTPTAAQLAYMTANAATGLPVTFTTSGGSTTAAVINLVDGSAGSATDDQYNGRLLVFTSGTLKGVVTDITDYTGATTTATITAIPFAPTATHTARLI